ncbi:uncharacterized protein LOC120271739 [Dioscorea cayenensis subsp. rotundata]|uniref:Hexosyltransferase n=1 Tax=Dioscorea cayennensis subsp. rotundata TaxID=55577 RepID=A0AB40C3L4_DIOCR|nr:uncharacterized protein LOC120271739 [Dioscorea cayenensis subsp. rotundata]
MLCQAPTLLLFSKPKTTSPFSSPSSLSQTTTLTATSSASSTPPHSPPLLPPFTSTSSSVTFPNPTNTFSSLSKLLRHNDIIILNNCTENMNSGKTYTFFSSLPHILPHPYDYIMKADDDVFFQLPNLAASLLPLPRRDLYYGFVIPCASKDPFKDYMSGMGYVLSWDLVEWISVSEIPAGEVVGPEDKLVGKWLKVGGKGMNRYSEKPGMYDYPGKQWEVFA